MVTPSVKSYMISGESTLIVVCVWDTFNTDWEESWWDNCLEFQGYNLVLDEYRLKGQLVDPKFEKTRD